MLAVRPPAARAFRCRALRPGENRGVSGIRRADHPYALRTPRLQAGPPNDHRTVRTFVRREKPVRPLRATGPADVHSDHRVAVLQHLPRRAVGCQPSAAALLIVGDEYGKSTVAPEAMTTVREANALLHRDVPDIPYDLLFGDTRSGAPRSGIASVATAASPMSTRT